MKLNPRLVTLLLITTIVITGCHNSRTDSSLISSLTSHENASEQGISVTTTSGSDITADTGSSCSENTDSDPENTDSDSDSENTDSSEEDSTGTDIPDVTISGSDTSAADTTDTTDVPVTDEQTPPTNSLLAEAMSSVSAKDCFVYNVDTDTLLALKGNGVNISPASVTKLLTSLYALQTVPDSLVISPKNEELSMVGKGSSMAHVKSHHKLTVKQLVEGMLLPSGNDAAYVLAAEVARYLNNDPDMSGAEAVNFFIRKMSEYAVSIGCTGTNFTVPDGLAGSEHFTSVHDLIIIGKLAINNPIISKYTSTVSEKVCLESGHYVTWTNSNLLIHPDSEYYSPYVTGLKTGSLSGNNCVYISAVIENKTYLIGVFGAPERNGRYVDAHIIINAIIEANKAGA